MRTTVVIVVTCMLAALVGFSFGGLVLAIFGDSPPVLVPLFALCFAVGWFGEPHFERGAEDIVTWLEEHV